MRKGRGFLDHNYKPNKTPGKESIFFMPFSLFFVRMLDIFHSITNEWAKFDTKDMFFKQGGHKGVDNWPWPGGHSTLSSPTLFMVDY